MFVITDRSYRPQIQRATSVVTSYLDSFNILINGGYKHTSEQIKETRQVPQKDNDGNVVTHEDGTPVLESKEFAKTDYRDIHIPAHGDRIKALHPFPIAPFPIMQGNGAGMATTLLRKRLEPTEEGWVEQRLQKAAQFADVPAEWGIEPRKLEAKEVKDKDDSDAEDNATTDRMPTKRVQGSLSDDDIMQMWKYAHQEVFDQQYLKSRYPEEYGGGEGEGDMGDEEGSVYEDESPEGKDEDEEDEDDDFEDVMDLSDTPDATKVELAVATAPPPPSAAARAAAPNKLAVHKPIPGLPVLSLSLVHKFMASGDATGY